MGPRSSQIRIWGPKRWLTPTKSGMPCNFCFIKFLPKRMAKAPETPCTPFMHPVLRGWGVLGWTPTPNPNNFVCLFKCFPNDMIWSGSAKNHGRDIFQGKGLYAGQGLPCRDWGGVLPTQMVLNINLVTPEIFIQFCPSIQKLFVVFFNTEGKTHKLHTKQITPLPYLGTDRNFLYPIFSIYLKMFGWIATIYVTV